MPEKNLVHEPLENQSVSEDIHSILAHINPWVRNFYDKGRLEVYGDEYAIVSSQANEGQDDTEEGLDYSNIKTSETLTEKIPLQKFRLYADKFSREYLNLVFSDSRRVEDYIEMKSEDLIWQHHIELNQACLDIITNINDNYSETQIITRPAEDYEWTTADNARDFINSVLVRANEMLKPSKNFNKLGKFSASYDKKRLVFVHSPKIDAMVRQLYSVSSNKEDISLKHEFLDVFVDPDLPKANEEKGNKMVHGCLMDEKSFVLKYKLNTPLHIDTSREKMFLRSYIGKWFAPFLGMVRFENATVWVEEEKTKE